MVFASKEALLTWDQVSANSTASSAYVAPSHLRVSTFGAHFSSCLTRPRAAGKATGSGPMWHVRAGRLPGNLQLTVTVS